MFMSKYSYEDFSQGYIDMAKINLEISEEFFMCEDEVMKLGDELNGNEMGGER